MLGRGVADHLSVAVGDSVTAVLPDASVSLVGLIPRQKKIKVVAIVDTQSELDQRSAYLALGDAARLFRRGSGVDGLNLRLSNMFDQRPWRCGRRGARPRTACTRSRGCAMHGNLYRAIEFQRAMMFLLLSLLVGVAAFNLVSALIMVVNQRPRRRRSASNARGRHAHHSSVVSRAGRRDRLGWVGLGLLLGTGTALLVQDGLPVVGTRVGSASHEFNTSSAICPLK
jgi:lipoprotein-releasing system permease protein